VSGLGELPAGFLRPELDGLVPYEPGKPVEEVQRELGLERVVKLASNEGPFGPFPEALEALGRLGTELNRYPDGGCFRLSRALAERHGVRPEEITVAAGADAVIGYLSYAVLNPGDEIVTGWPSFPSYVLDALKLGAVPVRVPLRDHRIDVDALLEAVTPRTRLAYIATPNNPTGTMTARAELDRWFEHVPEHVLTVVDQAYFEYIEHPDYPDAVEEYAKRGHRAVVLRTFSKIYGLAGLRVGYAVAPEGVVSGIHKVQRPFDVTAAGQEAALASLASPEELGRRRRVNREAMAALEEALREQGYDPVGPALGNFLFVEVGEDAEALNAALLRQGVIVRPMGAFGAPTALRITAGTPDEIAFFAGALQAVRAAEATG
jgi:histidinol-phosphate aminotransferase